MKEINFRAWDKRKNQMLGYVFVLGGGVGTYHAEGTSGYYEYLGSVEDVIPMQFTGLRDKNGVEIYEGDVLVCKGIKTRVEWKNSDAGFVEIGDEGEVYPAIDNGVVNVIGNIYENPELLQVQP